MTKRKAVAKIKPSRADSWAQWFERCARHYKDPRMKMAYYRDGRSGKPVSIKVMRAIQKDIWKKLKPAPHSRILDAGGGIGLFSRSFQYQTKSVVGTDISPTMMRDARRLNPNGKFVVCDIGLLPFMRGSFDRILCYSVFHYLKNTAQAIKALDEFMRVVKKNGSVMIGDVLYPPGFSEQKDTVKPAKKNHTPLKIWWPDMLSHSLTKQTFEPSFFINYCAKKKCRCKIIKQNIPGKETASSRYDVILEL